METDLNQMDTMLLILHQTTNFRHFKTERVYKRQLEFDENCTEFSKMV